MAQTKAQLIDGKGDAAFDTNTLFIDSTNNRVGIGTTSPSSLLHVEGNANASLGALIYNSNSLVNTEAALELRHNRGGVQSSAILSAVANPVGTADLKISVSGSERARIDSSGRLLVGTSSYSGSAKLVVQGDSTSPTNGGYMSFRRDVTPSAAGSTIGFTDYSNTAGSIGAYLFAESDGAWTNGSSHPTRLVFSTTANGAPSPTERMRIGQNGSVQIGRTTGQIDTELFTVQNGGQCGWIYQTANSNVVALTMRHTYAQSAQTAKMIRFLQNNGAEVGAITSTTTATAYGTSSDYRLKENVASVTDGIARLQQLKPSRFNFIADSDKTVDGFIAHEVQTVVPEAIIGEKDAVDDDGNPVYQGIDQSKLVPLLTAALQEAIGEIESLKARVAALEAS